ncbi:hypothetical protein DPSP01_007253 [Paraphaeosphaeria sporulosa]
MTDTYNLIKKINKFVSFITGENLKDWGYTLKRLQCYLGGASIAEALNNGTDIVFCGRVAKAAPSVGVRLWWHGWNREKDFDQIAGSLICGHLIECAAYVYDSYFSGFKPLIGGCQNLGFLIASLYADGSCTIEKEPNTGGKVS